MADAGGQALEDPRWREEQLRYRMLRGIYDRAGANCEVSVNGAEVGETLGLPLEEAYRVIAFLSEQGYLSYLGAGPRVCIVPQGIAYLEVLANRRRSVRA